MSDSQPDPDVVVHLLYEHDGQQRELGFVVGVLAELWGDTAPPPPAERRFSKPVTREDFDQLIQQIAPSLKTPLSGEASPVDLKFSGLQDFTPEGIAKQLPPTLAARAAEITQDAAFQRLHSAWRDLFLFVLSTETSPLLQIRVLPVRWQDHAFNPGALDWIAEPGQDPINLLVADLPVGATPETVGVFAELARVGEKANAPLLGAAAPGLFGLASFSNVPEAEFLQSLPDQPPLAWKRYDDFRSKPEAQYAVLLLPLGYKDNAAYALATRITAAFARYHWCAAIYDPVEPVEWEFYHRGLTAIRPSGNGHVIPVIPCCNKPRRLPDNREESEFLRFRRELPYFLCATQLAQYLKILVQESPTKHTAKEWGDILTERLYRYYGYEKQATAQKLLREGVVKVEDRSGQPVAGAFLQPWYQLEGAGIGLAIRLEVFLPPGILA